MSLRWLSPASHWKTIYCTDSHKSILVKMELHKILGHRSIRPNFPLVPLLTQKHVVIHNSCKNLASKYTVDAAKQFAGRGWTIPHKAKNLWYMILCITKSFRYIVWKHFVVTDMEPTKSPWQHGNAQCLGSHTNDHIYKHNALLFYGRWH